MTKSSIHIIWFVMVKYEVFATDPDNYYFWYCKQAVMNDVK